MFTGLNSYAQDTVRVNNTDITAPITYNAEDSIYFDAKKNIVYLYGKAFVDNGEIQLRAGLITMDLKNQEVSATYSIDEDSTEIDHPVFSDGSEEIQARTIRYNFKTEKAYIEEVKIQQDEIYLYMGTAKKHPNDHIHFRQGRFTTCDQDEPHFHFQLSKAVMIPEERIVTGPMNLWIKGIPTPLGLPFSIIPQMEDKTNGFLFPRITPLSAYGFGFQDLGYYIPINDRIQTTIYGTLYSRGSWGIANETEYAKIYKYRGDINIGFQQFRSGFPNNFNDNKVSVNWIHNMDKTASPYWNFRSNVKFISDNKPQNTLDPVNSTYYDNSFNSDITLNRYFPGLPITASTKLSVRQNSKTQNIALSSPSFNINISRFNPFKKVVKSSEGWRGLFKQFGVTYSLNADNRSTFKDSLLTGGRFDQIQQQFINGVKQRATVQTTASLFKNTWKLTPSMTYENTYNFQQFNKSYDVATNSTVTDTIQKGGMSQFLTFNAKVTTALYGYYRFVGNKKPLVRHVITPSFSFSYRPSLNNLVTDSIGVNKAPITYSPFERSLYPTTATKDQMLLQYGINNVFELKRKSEKDTVDGFKRTRIVDLFSINGQYDFLKDSMNLSDIRLDLRISPATWLNFVSNASFSPYAWNESTGKTTKYWATDSNSVIGRFTSINLTTSLTLAPKKDRDKINSILDNLGNSWSSDFMYYNLHPEQAINFEIPWKLTFSHIYNISTNQSISDLSPKAWIQNQTVMMTGDISLTKRWKLTSTTNFDILNTSITNMRVGMTRDLHCWQLSVTWVPIGGNKSFMFTIRPTANLLRDAKLDFRKPPVFL